MSERCAEIREKIAGMISAELPDEEVRTVEEHLRGCERCREFEQALREDDRLLTVFTRSMDEKIERLEERVMETISSREKHETKQVTTRRAVLSGWIPKLAVAAAAVIIVVALYNIIFRDQATDVVWARVIAQVEKAQDYICRIVRDAEPWDDLEMVAYFSKRYGQKKMMYRDGKLAAEVFVKPKGKKIHLIHHADEVYVTIGITSEEARKLTELTSAQDLVNYFESFEYREIGTREIDGQTAAGIEVNDPELWAGNYEGGFVRLWVSTKTYWPVLIEREFTADGGKVHVSEVLKDFQWNPSLSKSDFEIKVPDGYRKSLDFGDYRPDEEGAIEGLRSYAELTGGTYPSNLAFDTAGSEFREHAERLKASGDWKEENIKKFFRIRNASAFYAEMLKAEVEVEYFGGSVTARDFDKVLMRWRLDDGRYRVIYGDLRAETVETE